MAMGNTPKRNIKSIQALRGIAALMVVMHHLQNQTQRLGMAHIAADGLQAGVDIFFVISGFIMWVTTTGSGNRTAVDFYRDRIARIIPLYWIMTTIVVIILLIYPSSMYTTVFDIYHIITSFLFIAFKHPVTGVYQPILVPGWSLNLEMFFYLLFGASIALSKGKCGLRASIIIACLIMLYAVEKVFKFGGLWAFYTQGMLLEFAAGIFIGIVYVRGKVSHTEWWRGLMLAGFLALFLLLSVPETIGREIQWGLPATAIVAGAVFAPPVTSGVLERLGDWSYSLYLSHPITLAACYMMWLKFAGGMPVMLFPLFGISSALAASFIIYRFVEVPATSVTKSLLNSSVAPPSVALEALTK